MRTSIVAIWIAIGAATAPYAMGQDSPQQSPRTPSAQPPSAEPVSVSDAELETFATIYVDLLDTAQKFKGELESAKTQEEADEIQGRIQNESISKVTQRGWTPEKLNAVTAAINRDPALAEKAAKLIEEKS